MMPFNDLHAQYVALKDSIDSRIQAVLDHGQYIMGPEVKELEQSLANFVGVSDCVAVSSGTDSLLIAMMALDIGPGDEVITTPFSFMATCETVLLLGAKPVFVDIYPRTYNINPQLIERAITKNTKAIMPVSLFGQCADMQSINKIAKAHNLPVIEDAAQSFGAKHHGKRSCGLSTIGSTSFFPSKPLGCYGDGGALFTDDEDLAQKMREIRSHGSSRRYHHTRVGVNGRIDTIQAAVLLAKLERFDWELNQREIVAQRYTKAIKSKCSINECCLLNPIASSSCKFAITPPVIETANTSVYAQYTVEVSDRPSYIDRLTKSEIPTSIHYPTPLHLQPIIATTGYKVGMFPVAESAAERVFSLPMGPDLLAADQDRVIEALFK